MELIKSIKKNTFFLLLITIVILFFVLKDDFKNITTTLSRMDYKFIIIAIMFWLLSIILKGYVNYKTVNNKKQISLKEAIKHNVITQFFNGITPFSSGGQPMEIYMLTEHGISGAKATTITIQSFIFYQVALVLYGLLAVTYNAIFHIFPKVPLLGKLTLIGFLINTLVAIALFVITFSPKFTKKVTNIIIKLLVKLKIIKDEKKTAEKWNLKLEEFHSSAKVLRKRKMLFIEGVIINLISLTCLYIVPLFIVYSLHNYTSLNIADTLTSSAYVLIIGAFVPIPGASGGIEYGFLKFFGNFITGTNLSAILIIWRFITYYLGLIIGALAFSLEKKGD